MRDPGRSTSATLCNGDPSRTSKSPDLAISRRERDLFGSRRFCTNQPDVPGIGAGGVGEFRRPVEFDIGDRNLEPVAISAAMSGATPCGSPAALIPVTNSPLLILIPARRAPVPASSAII